MDSTKKTTVVNELFSPVRRRFPRRRAILHGINDLWQADLSVLESISKYNDGFKYLLCVIDCFSKFAYVEQLKTKTGKEVTLAFEKIVKKSVRPPANLHVDQGKEFFNSTFENYMKKLGINLYHTHSLTKAFFVERFQRTFKEKLFKQFAYQGSYRYLGVLQKIVDNYNKSPHRGIGGLAPKDVKTRKVEQFLLKTVYNHPKLFKKGKFNVGDHVRIADPPKIFDKSYDANWSTAIYTITKERITMPVTYKVKDKETGQELSKGFYEHELKKVKYPNIYLVKEVLKRKGNKVLVSWLGYSSDYNSWIDAADVV